MADPKVVKVVAVEKLPCMCGSQVCRHCGHETASTCDRRCSHCPACGCPFEKPLETSTPETELGGGAQ